MSHSISRQVEIDCLECGMNFTADVYVIVDMQEQPDLVDKMRGGTLHQVRCPECGHLLLLEIPLLLFIRNNVPHLVVVCAAGTSSEWNKQQGMELVRCLKDVAGSGWKNDWSEGGLGAMHDQAMLAAWLSGASKEAMQQLPRQQALEAARLKKEDPERYYMDLFYALVNAQDIPWKQDIMESNPDLLCDEAQDLLHARMGNAAYLKNSNALAVFSQNLFLLSVRRGDLGPAMRKKLEEG